MKAQSPAVDIAEYQHGYHFPDESVFKTRKGLDEEIVNAISRRKEEPEWMRQFRLRSLAAFRRKSMPNWGADLSAINFDEGLHVDIRKRAKRAVQGLDENAAALAGQIKG